MATTIFVKLNPDDWIEISPGVDSGHVSNTTDTTITYREDDIKPDATDLRGHHLRPDEIVQYTFGSAGGKIFMRSIREKGTIACTPGQTFFGCCEEIIGDPPPPTEMNNYLFQDGNNQNFMDGNNYGFN